MSWIEVVKGGKVAYSGTCSKCGKFVNNGEKCPFNLPAKTPQLMTTDTCPMRLEA